MRITLAHRGLQFFLRLLLCVGVWSVSPLEARTLEEIQQSGTLRICVAGSSAPFYQFNGEALAKFLGLRAQVTVFQKWDQQFVNT